MLTTCLCESLQEAVQVTQVWLHALQILNLQALYIAADSTIHRRCYADLVQITGHVRRRSKEKGKVTVHDA